MENPESSKYQQWFHDQFSMIFGVGYIAGFKDGMLLSTIIYPVIFMAYLWLT